MEALNESRKVYLVQPSKLAIVEAECKKAGFPFIKLNVGRRAAKIELSDEELAKLKEVGISYIYPLTMD